jgi:tryptophan synthase alpha chain
MSTPPGGERIAASIRTANATAAPALIPYITAGFPSRTAFRELLEDLAPHAAAIEVGVPFTDPMADGVTIQRASRIALEQGVTLEWILEQVAGVRGRVESPIILMGYLNPFLAFGLERLAMSCAAAGVCGLIVPDLPLEESAPLQSSLHAAGVGLIQLVSPVTPPQRVRQLTAATDGFLYAVSVAGVTGSAVATTGVPAYLSRLRAAGDARVPLCAGFGIRTPEQVRELAGHADGVIVGSALLEVLERGDSPAGFLHSLRA